MQPTFQETARDEGDGQHRTRLRHLVNATPPRFGESCGRPPGGGVVVVIDALAARFGGTAYAVLQLTAALERREDVAQLVVIAQRDSIVGRSSKASARVEPLLLDAPGTRFELAWRTAWEALRLPSVVGRRSSKSRRPGQLLRGRSASSACPVVCVLANPVPFAAPFGLASRLRRAAIARTRRFAVASYVPSTGMQSLVGDPPAKVVPLGVDRERCRPQRRPGTSCSTSPTSTPTSATTWCSTRGSAFPSPVRACVWWATPTLTRRRSPSAGPRRTSASRSMGRSRFHRCSPRAARLAPGCWRRSTKARDAAGRGRGERHSRGYPR